MSYNKPIFSTYFLYGCFSLVRIIYLGKYKAFIVDSFIVEDYYIYVFIKHYTQSLYLIDTYYYLVKDSYFTPFLNSYSTYLFT